MIDAQVSDSTPPVFILSCERAGSTLLRYIIDTHPEICSPGELHLGHLCEDLGHVADLLSVGEVAGAANSEERLRRINAEVRRMVTGLMETYAKSKGKRMWCEKTPRNLSYLGILKAVFPDAKFICLHRNCMDVVHSCIESSKVGFFVDISYYAKNIPSTYARNAFGHASVFADSWADKTAKLLAFERDNPERCFRVRYEDIVADPVGTLGPMFNFLGLDFDPAMLDAVFKSKHDRGPGDVKVMYTRRINSKSVGMGSAVSRSQLPAELLARVNGLLEELDYPVVGEDWDTSPSPFLAALAGREEEGAAQAITATRQVFDSYFPRRLKAGSDKLRGFDGTYKFVVTGDDGGVWRIDLEGAAGRVVAGEGEAPYTITLAANDLVDMVNGRLNAAAAFEMGKVRVTGDLRQVMGVGQVLLGG